MDGPKVFRLNFSPWCVNKQKKIKIEHITTATIKVAVVCFIFLFI